MERLTGMGPFDYNILLLRLFYLMPKTADHIKYLGQLIVVLLLCILRLLVSLVVWFSDLSATHSVSSVEHLVCVTYRRGDGGYLLLVFH